jgi:hypothetical protein
MNGVRIVSKEQWSALLASVLLVGLHGAFPLAGKAEETKMKMAEETPANPTVHKHKKMSKGACSHCQGKSKHASSKKACSCRKP